MGLSPFFFVLFLSSLGFLCFSLSLGYFNVYFLALVLFFEELLSFYRKTWKVTIQNSSLVWHVLRFSSGFPVLFLDLLISSEFALNGWGVLFSSTLNKPFIYNDNFIKGATYAAKLQIRAFSAKTSPSLILEFMETQTIPSEHRTPEMIKFLKESKKILVTDKFLLPHQATIHKNSGLEAHHLFFLDQYPSLKGYNVTPAVLSFMNEGFYILNPNFEHPTYLSELMVASDANKTLVAIAFAEGTLQLLTRGDYLDLSNDTKLASFIHDFIDLNKNKWSFDFKEVKNFPAIYVGVEDILALNDKDLTQILRIQSKTEWSGLTGKTFIPKTSNVLVNKFAPTTGEALLLEHGEPRDCFNLYSYKHPKIKTFCENLFENAGKPSDFLKVNHITIVKNTIKLALKDKLND